MRLAGPHVALSSALIRAFVQRVPAATVGRLYFGEDEGGHTPSPAAIERCLLDIQADLVNLALEHGSSVLAEHLKASARKLGSARLSAQHSVIAARILYDIAPELGDTTTSFAEWRTGARAPAQSRRVFRKPFSRALADWPFPP